MLVQVCELKPSTYYIMISNPVLQDFGYLLHTTKIDRIDLFLNRLKYPINIPINRIRLRVGIPVSA